MRRETGHVYCIHANCERVAFRSKTPRPPSARLSCGTSVGNEFSVQTSQVTIKCRPLTGLSSSKAVLGSARETCARTQVIRLSAKFAQCVIGERQVKQSGGWRHLSHRGSFREPSAAAQSGGVAKPANGWPCPAAAASAAAIDFQSGAGWHGVCVWRAREPSLEPGPALFGARDRGSLPRREGGAVIRERISPGPRQSPP